MSLPDLRLKGTIPRKLVDSSLDSQYQNCAFAQVSTCSMVWYTHSMLLLVLRVDRPHDLKWFSTAYGCEQILTSETEIYEYEHIPFHFKSIVCV